MRGRQKKLIETKIHNKLDTLAGIHLIKHKRAYKKRIKNEPVIKQPKKRGRKIGKKEYIQLYKPNEILDYIQRNYPALGVDKIKTKLLNAIVNEKTLEKKTYILTPFIYNNTTYYYDEYNSILNTSGSLIGFQLLGEEYATIYTFDAVLTLGAQTYEEINRLIGYKYLHYA